MNRIGTGKGLAALLNGRAKRVTPQVVNKLRSLLPDALILVSQDFDEARRHADRIAHEKPDAVFSGGGDGAVTKLLNLLREAGVERFPSIGVLRLGTGNGWARVAGSPRFVHMVDKIPLLPKELPTDTYNLTEVEGTLTHFTGVGWDAKILNDYLRNMERRQEQLVGSDTASRLHKGLVGYMYALFRITVPEEFMALWKHGQPEVKLENLGEMVSTLSAQGEVIPIAGSEAGGPRSLLYNGKLSVGAAGSSTEWGYGFKAFPFARLVPGRINVRIYDRPVSEGVREMFNLWAGKFPQPGMFDWFATKVRMTFSRPMPFQIGGDGVGLRESIEFAVAKETVPIVNWGRALEMA
jgi:diacylglycerol kinase family enzyme